MPQLIISGCSADIVTKAEEIINNFLNVLGNSIYVINADGSTFALEPGCTLLPTERFHTECGMEV